MTIRKSSSKTLNVGWKIRLKVKLDLSVDITLTHSLEQLQKKSVPNQKRNTDVEKVFSINGGIYMHVVINWSIGLKIYQTIQNAKRIYWIYKIIHCNQK